MITCYVMSLLTFVMLIAAFAQSHFHFQIFQASPLTFIILTSIVYLFTETLVIFFFVGTGVSVKEYTLEHHLKNDYYKKTIAIKRKVYPPLLLNMGLMMTLFILAGAVDTGHLPRWGYQIFFASCLGHYVYAKKNQNDCFRENTENILAMSGLHLRSR